MDVWWFAGIVLRRWPWLIMGGLGLGLVGLAGGMHLWRSSYSAPAQLIAYDSPNTTAIFGERQVNAQTIISVLRAPELLQQAGAGAVPPVSAAELNSRLSVMPDRNSDIIVVTITDDHPESALEAVNRYADEAVRYTQKLQATSASELNAFFNRQLTNIDAAILALDQQARSLPPPVLFASGSAAAALNPLDEELQAAQKKLIELLGSYTEANPLVQAQRARIAALENMVAKGPVTTNTIGNATNAGWASAPPTGENDPELVRSKLQTLESARLELLGKQQAVQSFAANPPGYCRLLAPATLKDVVTHKRNSRVLGLVVFLALLGVAGTAAMVLLAEFLDNRLKNSTDVQRVTRLPVLTAAGDLDRLDESSRREWAFRAWTDLQGRLSPSPNHGLICGVTSSDHREGRSTWVNSLAEAASNLGFRVLTIATRPSPTDLETPEMMLEDPTTPAVTDVLPEACIALTPNVLASPAAVTQQLIGPNPQPIVHIPLPGWVWNLERRKQWQEALKHWAQIDNIVILVELPPAALPEAVLLAQNLPNVVWLTDCLQADAAETRQRLATLRSARCHLAGAVLNHAPDPALKQRFSRWMSA